MANNVTQTDRSIIEQLTRINLRNADINRKNQECLAAPILFTLTAMGSSAALFASAWAFFKFVGL